MKITDIRIVKPTEFGDVKVGDVFQSDVTKNICIKTNREFEYTNAFCLNKNEEVRFCINDKITLLDVELTISG